MLSLGAQVPARAEDSPAADWEPTGQVLEIPQSCVPDGALMTCEVTPPDGDSFSSATVDLPDAGDPTAETGAQSPPADSGNIDEASSDPSLGNLQDYESQTIAEAPIAPIYTSGVDTGPPLSPPVYFLPAAPLAIARPLGPGAWMIPPRYRSRSAPMRSRPGSRPFRVR